MGSSASGRFSYRRCCCGFDDDCPMCKYNFYLNFTGWIITYNIMSLPLSLKLVIFLTLYTYIVVTDRYMYMYAKRWWCLDIFSSLGITFSHSHVSVMILETSRVYCSFSMQRLTEKRALISKRDEVPSCIFEDQHVKTYSNWLLPYFETKLEYYYAKFNLFLDNWL